MIGQDDPRRIEGSWITAEMLPMLGAKPFIGRVFTAQDDRDTAPGTIVLSFGLWQGEFGGDAAVLGRKIVLDDRLFTVVGVMPKGFYFPTRDVEYWTATRFESPVFEDRTNTYVHAAAKLRRGVSLENARSRLKKGTMPSPQSYVAHPPGDSNAPSKQLFLTTV